MKINHLLAWLCIPVIGLGACAPSAPTIAPIILATAPVQERPIIGSWVLSKESAWFAKDFSIVIQAMEIESYETTAVYSSDSLGVEKLLSMGEVRLVEDTGRVLGLIQATPVLAQESLEIGVMTFEAVGSNAKALKLTFTDISETSKVLEIPIAAFIGERNVQNTGSTRFVVVQDMVHQQGEMSVVLEQRLSGSTMPGNPSDSATAQAADSKNATPTGAPSPLLSDVTQSTSVYSFRISDSFGKTEHELFVQLHGSAGEVMRSLDGVIEGAPAVYSRPVPTREGYPAP